MWISPKLFLDQQGLEINWKMVSRGVANFYSVFSRENYGILCSLGVSPLQYSALFALRRSHGDLMFQLIKMSGCHSITLVLSRPPMPWDSLTVPFFSMARVYKSGLLIFWAVVEPWNSGKSAKSHEIHKNMQVRQHLLEILQLNV